MVTPDRDGGQWEVRTLVDLPYVHRFDILSRDGHHYLLACALKSGYEGKDDWSKPGKVFAAELPEDLSGYNEAHQLPLQVLKDGMLKNHGYSRLRENDMDTALVSCDNGIYQFIPPCDQEHEWQIITLLEEPASDAVMVDLDGDGEGELAVISPFHGEFFRIYKKLDGKYCKVYEYPEPMEFLHAIYGGSFCGKNTVIVGHRKGERNLMAFTYDIGQHSYIRRVIDTDCGAANVMKFCSCGKDVLISANREINEIAMYQIKDF